MSQRGCISPITMGTMTTRPRHRAYWFVWRHFGAAWFASVGLTVLDPSDWCAPPPHFVAFLRRCILMYWRMYLCSPRPYVIVTTPTVITRYVTYPSSLICTLAGYIGWKAYCTHSQRRHLSLSVQCPEDPQPWGTPISGIHLWCPCCYWTLGCLLCTRSQRVSQLNLHKIVHPIWQHIWAHFVRISRTIYWVRPCVVNSQVGLHRRDIVVIVVVVASFFPHHMTVLPSH